MYLLIKEAIYEYWGMQVRHRIMTCPRNSTPRWNFKKKKNLCLHKNLTISWMCFLNTVLNEKKQPWKTCYILLFVCTAQLGRTINTDRWLPPASGRWSNEQWLLMGWDSFGGNENVSELDSGDNCTIYVNILISIQLYALRVNFPRNRKTYTKII